MKIRPPLAESVQWALSVMAADDMSPFTFVVDYVDEEKKIRAGLVEHSDLLIWWQETVDVIARLLISGIISMLNAKDIDDALDSVKSDMADHNPYDTKDYQSWFYQQLYASDVCRELLDKYGVTDCDSALNIAFIEEIESLFAQAGVPMGGPPLIPIRCQA